jgi:GTPase SAR1 family protein
MDEQTFAIKVLLVGEGNVGKTSLLLRYAVRATTAALVFF